MKRILAIINISAVIFFLCCSSAFASFTATKDAINANGANITDILLSGCNYIENSKGYKSSTILFIQRVSTGTWTYKMIASSDTDTTALVFSPAYVNGAVKLGIDNKSVDSGVLSASVYLHSSSSTNESKIISASSSDISGSAVFSYSSVQLKYNSTTTDNKGNSFYYASSGGNLANAVSQKDAFNIYEWDLNSNSLKFMNALYIDKTTNQFEQSAAPITQIKGVTDETGGGSGGGSNIPDIDRPVIGGGGEMVVYDTSVWNDFFDYVRATFLIVSA